MYCMAIRVEEERFHVTRYKRTHTRITQLRYPIENVNNAQEHARHQPVNYDTINTTIIMSYYYYY